jgi:hypothetical protein
MHVLGVVVDLAVHGHDADAVNHGAVDQERFGSAGLVVVGHRLLDCGWLARSQRVGVILPRRCRRMHCARCADGYLGGIDNAVAGYWCA